MVPRPPGSNRTDTLFPDTTLCRSLHVVRCQGGADRLIALDSPLAHGRARDHGRGTPVRRFVAGLMPTPAVRSGQPRTHSRECGRQPAHQSLITDRSEEHTSELQSLMRISYAVFSLKTKRMPK